MGYSVSDNLAGGINALTDFYNAWPYNSGISLSGFKSLYQDSDISSLGSLYLSLGESSGRSAMQNLAQGYGMEEPSISDLQNALISAGAQSASLAASAVSTLESGAVSVGNATGSLLSQAGSVEASAVSGINSLLSSPKTVLFLGGIVILGAVLFIYSGEIKGALKAKKLATQETPL